MKKTVLKRFTFLIMALVLTFSFIPADAIEKGIFASASDLERSLKAATAPAWIEDAVFDAKVYGEKYGLTNMSDSELKKHWNDIGIPEGRTGSAVLDLKYYLGQYEDLQNAFGSDYQKAYNHFIKSGYKEKRKSSPLFDGAFYCANYTDVATEYKDEYLRHYVETGMKEGRRGSLIFDPDYYMFINPSLAETWNSDYEACARHYAIYGKESSVAAYDTKYPVISDITFSNVSTEGYTVSCKVTDDWGIRKVAFPSWTSVGGDDDIPNDYMNTQKGTRNGDYFVFRVKTSDHGNATGNYITNICAVDHGGNIYETGEISVSVKGEPSNSFILYSFSNYSLTDKFVKNVEEETTVNGFVGQFENEKIKVFNSSDVQILGKVIVGTGNVINLYKGENIVDSLSVVIDGDVNGDGVVDSTDCMRVKAALLDLFEFSESQFEAADSDENESLNATDYIRLKYKLLSVKSEETESNEAKKPSLEFSDTLYVTEKGTSAHVVAAGGVVYDASGYISYANNLFTINSGFTMNLSKFTSRFNRLTLCYVASEPMKCTVTYKVGSTTINDLFYLEAGTQTFCGLIQGYLDGKLASNLSKISISTCEGVNGTFALCNVKTEEYEVFDAETHYIETDEYQFGICLKWGGGISHIVDKKSSIDGITNLVNRGDMGRLIQQSYYGTDNHNDPDYEDGSFHGTIWGYNPVQGGDQGDVNSNKSYSRLIDVIVGETTVYIKAQPMDWGHIGKITPSYMENVYYVEEGYIRVDNRFVDFSGYDHFHRDQELPAFYTISYLDNFTCYTGSKPWTDDTLSSNASLPNWGRANNDENKFKMKESNTETWCAWTSSAEGYGIGLYTPNVDMFLAGRFEYDGNKNSNSVSTNYVAPVNFIELVSYFPLEYSYLITTGTLEEIRNTFKENKDFATNESLRVNCQSYRIPD